MKIASLRMSILKETFPFGTTLLNLSWQKTHDIKTHYIFDVLKGVCVISSFRPPRNKSYDI